MSAVSTAERKSSATDPPERRRPGRHLRRAETGFGLAMIVPALLIVVLFTAAPIVASFALALFSWDVISPPTFVGAENFLQMGADERVVHSFAVTIGLGVAIVLLQLVLALLLATLVQQRRSTVARALFRTAFFLPLLASSASVAIFMGYLFDEKFGVVNYYLGLLGASNVPWLTTSWGASTTIVLVAVWQSLGFNFVLFVAALSSLPTDILEAAAIDGSSAWRTLIAVKLPLISPSIFFAAVVGLINALQLFDQPYIMTSGGPGTATTTVTMVIYQTAFQNLQFGYGSAIAIALFLVLLAITGLQFLAARKWVFYS